MLRRGILVVGSANMDLVVTAERFPRPGETMFGRTFGMFPGGKGANQAVAAARLGGQVAFIGKMGRDVLRDDLCKSLKRDGVCLEALSVDPHASTGMAMITVDGSGQNEIVVVSGSNMSLSPAEVERGRSYFHRAGVVLLQLEIPLPTVARAAKLARESGAEVILNPAPARSLPVSLLRLANYLTPNETELGQLTGKRTGTAAAIESAARALVAKGVGHVIVTLGSKGALLVTREGSVRFPGRKVRAVDTTAAGDAFNGALAFALATGQRIEKAIPFANAAAAVSVTRIGAQKSMATLDEVRAMVPS